MRRWANWASLPAVTRFFGILCWLSALFLGVALAMGYFHAQLGLDASHHLLMGLTAVMLSVSAHCLIFGIFTGSGKDTRELVQDLSLDPEFAARTKAFRRVVFPPALYAILLLVVSSVLGGALGAKPNAVWLRWAHSLCMIFTLFYNYRTFWLEYRAVRDNARILDTVNRVAGEASSRVPQPPRREDEPALMAAAVTPLEWGAHVFALGKFLCFLGWNVWLPYIYLKYIVGYFRMPLWPYLALSLGLIGGGYWLRYRYRSFRPAPTAGSHPA